MICESCWSNLQEADKLIRTFKNENDFEGKRKETTGGFRILSEVRETEKRFFVCRCCLASQTIVFLKIINEFEAEKLKVVTGIEVRVLRYFLDVGFISCCFRLELESQLYA